MTFKRATSQELRSAGEAAFSASIGADASEVNTLPDILDNLNVGDFAAQTYPVWKAQGDATSKRMVDLALGLLWGLQLGAAIQAGREMDRMFSVGEPAPDEEAETLCEVCSGSGRHSWSTFFRSGVCRACQGRGRVKKDVGSKADAARLEARATDDDEDLPSTWGRR